MKLTKAELAVLVVLLAIVGAGALIFETHQHLVFELPATPGGQLVLDRYAYGRYIATLIALASGFTVALLYLLPLVRAQSREHGKLHTLTDVLRRRSHEMERAAHTDVLTGLHNRRYFNEALAQFMREFGRIGRPIGLLVLDLDHFKSINDTYGHDIGDEVLRAVSRCIADYCRHHDIVARLGGEEFAVVVPNMNETDLRGFADRLRQAVERLSLDVGNVRLRITMSVGIAVARREEEPASLCKRADVNLYAAKEAGRNRICA